MLSYSDGKAEQPNNQATKATRTSTNTRFKSFCLTNQTRKGKKTLSWEGKVRAKDIFYILTVHEKKKFGWYMGGMCLIMEPILSSKTFDAFHFRREGAFASLLLFGSYINRLRWMRLLNSEQSRHGIAAYLLPKYVHNKSLFNVCHGCSGKACRCRWRRCPPSPSSRRPSS